jgi:hypothetical protein
MRRSAALVLLAAALLTPPALAAPSADAAVPPSLTWTQTGSFDTARGQMLDLSCASDAFCAAIDDARVVTYDGTNWQAPVGLDKDDGLIAIDCPSTSFCVVTNASGSVYTYDGASWSRAQTVDAGQALVAVSCPSAVWCIALEKHGQAFTYDGTDWSEHQFTGLDNAAAISCFSPTSCLAGGTS